MAIFVFSYHKKGVKLNFSRNFFIFNKHVSNSGLSAKILFRDEVIVSATSK
jgi:hypothetical protein